MQALNRTSNSGLDFHLSNFTHSSFNPSQQHSVTSPARTPYQLYHAASWTYDSTLHPLHPPPTPPTAPSQRHNAAPTKPRAPTTSHIDIQRSFPPPLPSLPFPFLPPPFLPSPPRPSTFPPLHPYHPKPPQNYSTSAAPTPSATHTTRHACTKPSAASEMWQMSRRYGRG
jgi:hypothetical protein